MTGSPLSRESMLAFADDWISNWNRRDVDAVLSHFADDAVFVSPVAAKYVGSSTIEGKQALSNYWRAALERLDVLTFTLDHASWDEQRRELNVVYEANLNGSRRRACELMTFDADGRQIRGEAMYGADM